MPETMQPATSAEPPLFAAVRNRDLGAVQRALAAGENPRRMYRGETPLHCAAAEGALDIVEALIAGGALEWIPDAQGKRALDRAREGATPQHAAVAALLDRDAIADPSFRAAVVAIHSGDVAALARLLDAEPRLLRERIVGPEVYRKRARPDYFRDPKLFWYVANNPTTVDEMAPNIVAVAQAMIERGVEQADLDYALELVMSSGVAREQGHQRPLMRALLDAGAVPNRRGVAAAAGHLETDALRMLLEKGVPLDAPIAATLNDVEALRRLLPDATREDVQTAFGYAVINGHVEAARLALDAGADVDAFLPIHTHSTALHDAAARNDLAMIAMLLAAGARRNILDTLWDGTPSDWARHVGNAAASAALALAPAT
jgi:ankyrin repeat protein